MLGFFMFFDPLWLLVAIPSMLLAGWAHTKVNTAYARASKMRASGGRSGAEAAAQLLRAHGLSRVSIERTRGRLSDHYDPRNKVLRLSPDVYDGRSLASVGIAAHEAGHAIQDSVGYGPLRIRNGLVPLASVGSNLSIFLFMGGMILAALGATFFGPKLMVAAIVLFAITVVFQIVNLPVEFDASNRARQLLVSSGAISSTQEKEVARVLNAAALTYIAATIGAVLTLLYLIMRSGLLGGRD